jgi:hypothetical protein
MEAWNPMAMMTSGLEYPTIIANEKAFVGKSQLLLLQLNCSLCDC